jgi:hypothetical protein
LSAVELGEECAKLLTLEFMSNGASDEAGKASSANTFAEGSSEPARNADGKLFGWLSHVIFLPK